MFTLSLFLSHLLGNVSGGYNIHFRLNLMQIMHRTFSQPPPQPYQPSYATFIGT